MWGLGALWKGRGELRGSQKACRHRVVVFTCPLDRAVGPPVAAAACSGAPGGARVGGGSEKQTAFPRVMGLAAQPGVASSRGCWRVFSLRIGPVAPRPDPRPPPRSPACPPPSPPVPRPVTVAGALSESQRTHTRPVGSMSLTAAAPVPTQWSLALP